MTLFWTIFLIGFIMLEALTTQLVCIWFAGGALAALLSAFCGIGNLGQAAVFVLVSALLLVFTRQFVRRIKSKEPVKTNAEALIDTEAIVLEDISNVEARGSVKVGGIVWSARSADGKDIDAGTHIIVKEIDGVKLLVSKLEEE